MRTSENVLSSFSNSCQTPYNSVQDVPEFTTQNDRIHVKTLDPNIKECVDGIANCFTVLFQNAKSLPARQRWIL